MPYWCAVAQQLHAPNSNHVWLRISITCSKVRSNQIFVSFLLISEKDIDVTIGIIFNVDGEDSSNPTFVLLLQIINVQCRQSNFHGSDFLLFDVESIFFLFLL